MCGVCLVVGLCVGLPLLGSFQNEWNVLLPFILCIFFLSMAFSSLFTFIAMTCKSKASSAVICILTAFLLIFAATYIQAQLSEPEIYDSYIDMDETGNIGNLQISERFSPRWTILSNCSDVHKTSIFIIIVFGNPDYSNYRNRHSDFPAKRFKLKETISCYGYVLFSCCS